MGARSMDWPPGDGVVHVALHGRTRRRVRSGVSNGKTLLQGSNPLKRACAPWGPVCAGGVITTAGTWRSEAAYSGLHACKWLLRSTVRANSLCVSAHGRSVHQEGSCCCSSSLSSPAGQRSTGPGLCPPCLVVLHCCLPCACSRSVPT